MGDITYLGLFLITLTVIPILFLNRSYGIHLNKQILIAVARMFIQLFIVGVYLTYIFELNNSLLNILYMLIMIFIATHSIIRSTNLKSKKMYHTIFISILVPNILMVVFFNCFVINLNNVFDARYIITISGMLLGNVLSGDIIGLNSYYKGIKRDKEIINYELVLGATIGQATKSYFQEAISSSIKPTIATIATIGLVSLPGMMTGQILGGTVPTEAVMYQIAIMIAILITRYFNIFLALTFTKMVMFDTRDQLIKTY